MAEKRKLAIIGASYLQNPLILKAKEMGLETHVFAWECGDVGERTADVFYPISIVEKEAILSVCQKIGICGICSIASDLAMVTVNYVANAMGLTCNSPESTYISTNKHAMRQAFEKRGDPSPKSYRVTAPEDIVRLAPRYPVIIKPTDRSGSRGIFLAESEAEARKAIEDAIAVSFEKAALVEEYARGQEYSVEYISYQGQHTFLALTEKTTTGAPDFIETRHYQPARVSPELLSRIQNVVTHALDTLLVTCGASHSELKVDENGEIRLIEIGARMGGGCIGSDLVQLSTGKDYVKMVIQIACGEAPDLEVHHSGRAAEIVFILTEEDNRIYQQLLTESPVKIIRTAFYNPEWIGKVKDESNRAGCYVLDAE